MNANTTEVLRCNLKNSYMGKFSENELVQMGQELWNHPERNWWDTHCLACRAMYWGDWGLMGQAQVALLQDPSTSSDELVELALGYNRRTSESVANRALDILVERGDVQQVERVGCTYNNHHPTVMRRAWKEARLMCTARQKQV